MKSTSVWIILTPFKMQVLLLKSLKSSSPTSSQHTSPGDWCHLSVLLAIAFAGFNGSTKSQFLAARSNCSVLSLGLLPQPDVYNSVFKLGGSPDIGFWLHGSHVKPISCRCKNCFRIKLLPNVFLAILFLLTLL